MNFLSAMDQTICCANTLGKTWILTLLTSVLMR